MKTIVFSIRREYDIMCKMFLPQDRKVKHVMIGVHGFAGDKESSMLEQLAGACTNNAVALICFDFPAHGTSPVAEDQLTIENCKEDLLFIAEYVRNEYPNATKSVFATSFGGYIALLCYEKLSEFKFVLRAPAVTMPDVLLNNVLKISADRFKTLGFVDCGFERPIKLPYSFYEELLCQDNLFLNSYTRPMLIIHGDQDDIVPFSIISKFANMHSNVELNVVKGADHRFKKAGEIAKIINSTRQFLNI